MMKDIFFLILKRDAFNNIFEILLISFFERKIEKQRAEETREQRKKERENSTFLYLFLNKYSGMLVKFFFIQERKKKKGTIKNIIFIVGKEKK